jgi:GT2 family glycosyltransferase
MRGIARLNRRFWAYLTQIEIVRRIRRRSQAAAIRESGLFEPEWYLSQYRGVAASNADPIEHYLDQGAAERRDPGPLFSTRFYLERNPDVVAAGQNPLLHYIRHGKREARQTRKIIGPDDGPPTAPTKQEESRLKREGYASWSALYNAVRDVDCPVFRKAIDRFAIQPKISVLMTVAKGGHSSFARTINSVRAQLYPNWELCIPVDASLGRDVRDLLDAEARQDVRIKIIAGQTSSGISTRLNSALAAAAGDYVALLDTGDELTEHALFWTAHEIAKNPDADLIYTDEDRISPEGPYDEPYFKPDWNPAYILSCNYFSRLVIYRKHLVDTVGGFRAGFEGSEDYDLNLRCIDGSRAERIHHIPRVLYHREAPISDKDVATRISGARAIQDHLDRNNIRGVVRFAPRSGYSVDYPMPASPPNVSIIILSTCKLHLIKPCIEHLMSRTTYSNFEVLIAVNEISLEVPEQANYLNSVKSSPRIRVLVYEDQAYNFSRLNNWAIEYAIGTVLCFMNDDIEVITPDWLEQLVARLQLNGVGAVGPMLYYPNDTIQQAGVILGIGSVAAHAFVGLPKGHAGYFGRAALEQDLSCVTAACMLMRRSIFEKLSGFDESFAIAFNDVDLCIRIRNAGWRIIWVPQVELYHHESASIGKHDIAERQLQFQKTVNLVRSKWEKQLLSDPAYNPNLSLEAAYALPIFPPRIDRLPELQL